MLMMISLGTVSSALSFGSSGTVSSAVPFASSAVVSVAMSDESLDSAVIVLDDVVLLHPSKEGRASICFLICRNEPFMLSSENVEK